MPQVKIEKDFSISADQVLKQVEALLKNSKDLQVVEPHLDVKIDSENHTLVAQGKKISGNVKVQNTENGSHLSLQIELPWSLAPFKGMVQSKLEAKIAEIC